MCSMELTGGSFPMVPEAGLYHSVQTVLPRDTGGDFFNKGILRWTLHKKVQNNPASSLSLVRVLIKELEKAERCDSRNCIIPLLHTLMYAIMQAAFIPDDLYKRVYDFCKRLLTYPHPYCSVGLSYTRQIKTERLVPGLMYQRMLTAEQRLKNEHYPFQERVFVLADPEVFSGSLIPALFDEASAGLSSLDHMCSVVQHTIQASLGEQECHGSKLAHVLKHKGQDIEAYFQEVQAILEQMADEGSKREGGALRSQIQKLHTEIFLHADSEPLCGGPLCDCPLPNPEMSFHLWTEDLDIWRELTKWFRSSNYMEQFPSFCEDDDDFDFGDPLSALIEVDMPRFSILSNDSGIVKDHPPGDDTFSLSSLDTNSLGNSGEPSNGRECGKLNRRNCLKIKPSRETGRLIQETLEDDVSQAGGRGSDDRRGTTLQRRAGATTVNFHKQQKPYTAKIVIMGDDRVVGRLTKAYYLLKKREARRLYLTSKVNLQFYYIPVCVAPSRSDEKSLSESRGDSCSLGSYLSNVDPWYKCNIKSLDVMIHKLAKMQPLNTGRPKDPFISDVISYYVRCGQQPVYFNIFFVKISFIRQEKETVKDVFVTHLDVEFPEFIHFYESMKGDKIKKGSAEFCGAVISMNYKKVTLSGRDVEKGLSVRTARAQISAIPSSEAEDLNCLTLTFNDVCLKNKGTVVESKIRSNNIKIRTLERRSFTVTLDKDSRRTYTDVQSMEISPCLDPGYFAHRTKRPKLDPDKDQEAGFSKYMKKTLLLPINTFAGIIN